MHPGLLIVDHVHFQYNGFLLGILVWVFVFARRASASASSGAAGNGDYYLMATTFAILLCFKHIFVYLAPPVGIFLLRRCCFPSPPSTENENEKPTTKSQSQSQSQSRNSSLAYSSFSPQNFINLSLIVLTVLLISFGPFFLASAFSVPSGSGDSALLAGIEGLVQIFRRLFPFQRGLNHAYWAPNVWSFVTLLDRLLIKYASRAGLPIRPSALTSNSRGLVGDTSFGVLPDVTPDVCFALVVAFSLVYAVKLWIRPSYRNFLTATTLSAFVSFEFGWHVHEKAALLFLVPLSLLAVEDVSLYSIYVLCTLSSLLSLFPLLINPAETPIKVLYTLIWAGMTFPTLARVVHRPTPSAIRIVIDALEKTYLVGLVAVQLYVMLGHTWLFGARAGTGAAVGEEGPTRTTTTEAQQAYEALESPHAHAHAHNFASRAYPSHADGLTDGMVGAAAVVVEQVARNLTAAVGRAVGVEKGEATVAGAGAGVGVGAGEGAMEFLPLMLTSVYCAIGIAWSWLRLMALYLVKF